MFCPFECFKKNKKKMIIGGEGAWQADVHATVHVWRLCRMLCSAFQTTVAFRRGGFFFFFFLLQQPAEYLLGSVEF